MFSSSRPLYFYYHYHYIIIIIIIIIIISMASCLLINERFGLCILYFLFSTSCIYSFLFCYISIHISIHIILNIREFHSLRVSHISLRTSNIFFILFFVFLALFFSFIFFSYILPLHIRPTPHFFSTLAFLSPRLPFFPPSHLHILSSLFFSLLSYIFSLQIFSFLANVKNISDFLFYLIFQSLFKLTNLSSTFSHSTPLF